MYDVMMMSSICHCVRYFLVQKAKEARTVGILVGTLGAGMVCGVVGMGMSHDVYV